MNKNNLRENINKSLKNLLNMSDLKPLNESTENFGTNHLFNIIKKGDADKKAAARMGKGYMLRWKEKDGTTSSKFISDLDIEGYKNSGIKENQPGSIELKKTSPESDIKKYTDKGYNVKLNEEIDLEKPYAIIAKGGSIGGNKNNYLPQYKGVVYKTFDDLEEAKGTAKRLRSQLSKGQKSYYGEGYVVIKLTPYILKMLKTDKTEKLAEGPSNPKLVKAKSTAKKIIDTIWDMDLSADDKEELANFMINYIKNSPKEEVEKLEERQVWATSEFEQIQSAVNEIRDNLYAFHDNNIIGNIESWCNKIEEYLEEYGTMDIDEAKEDDEPEKEDNWNKVDKEDVGTDEDSLDKTAMKGAKKIGSKAKKLDFVIRELKRVEGEIKELVGKWKNAATDEEKKPLISQLKEKNTLKKELTDLQDFYSGSLVTENNINELFGRDGDRDGVRDLEDSYKFADKMTSLEDKLKESDQEMWDRFEKASGDYWNKIEAEDWSQVYRIDPDKASKWENKLHDLLGEEHS